MDNKDVNSRRFESLSTEGRASVFFSELLSELKALCESSAIVDIHRVADNLEKLWLPIAIDLVVKRKKLNRTLIQGILGSQGTGKTTLCKIIRRILNYFGYSTATVSIDDLYLSYAERQALQQQDPRLIWRGPPGTHDVDLGIKVIDRCLRSDNTTEILLPRFDKSAFNGQGDRTTPEAILKPDILLFEGWFIGVQPLQKYPTRFPLPIVIEADRQFALECDRRLQAYLPLWLKLDSLIVLYPEDYRLSQQWRKEAEQKMIATGKTGMSDEECDRFVEYFWKALHPELYIKPLIQTADLVIKIKGDRKAYLRD